MLLKLVFLSEGGGTTHRSRLLQGGPPNPIAHVSLRLHRPLILPLHPKDELNEDAVIEIHAYSAFCAANAAAGSHDMLMGGHQSGPLNDIICNALGRFADKGPATKTVDALQNKVLLMNEVTNDSSKLLRHVKTMQWHHLRGKLWKVVEDHYKYKLKVGELAMVATEEGLLNKDAYTVFLKRRLWPTDEYGVIDVNKITIGSQEELKAVCRRLYVTFDASYVAAVKARTKRILERKKNGEWVTARTCMAPAVLEPEVPPPSSFASAAHLNNLLNSIQPLNQDPKPRL